MKGLSDPIESSDISSLNSENECMFTLLNRFIQYGIKLVRQYISCTGYQKKVSEIYDNKKNIYN